MSKIQELFKLCESIDKVTEGYYDGYYDGYYIDQDVTFDDGYYSDDGRTIYVYSDKKKLKLEDPTFFKINSSDTIYIDGNSARYYYDRNDVYAIGKSTSYSNPRHFLIKVLDNDRKQASIDALRNRSTIEPQGVLTEFHSSHEKVPELEKLGYRNIYRVLDHDFKKYFDLFLLHAFQLTRERKTLVVGNRDIDNAYIKLLKSFSTSRGIQVDVIDGETIYKNVKIEDINWEYPSYKNTLKIIDSAGKAKTIEFNNNDTVVVVKSVGYELDLSPMPDDFIEGLI